MYAKGTIRFDGQVKLRAGVAYRKPFLGGIPLVGPIIMFFTGTIRRALTTVDVTGDISDPKIRLVSVQYLTSPVKAVFSFFKEEEKGE